MEITPERVRNARSFFPWASGRQVQRALRESITELRRMEFDLYGLNATSATALRLGALRMELSRVEQGLHVRPDSLVRALVGLRTVVPVQRKQSATALEVVAR